MLRANIKEIISLHSCSTFFNLSDLLGIKVVSFLHSSSSCPGILISSSTPRARSHRWGSVFSTLFIIYHSHRLSQTVFPLCFAKLRFSGTTITQLEGVQRSSRASELGPYAIVLTRVRGCLASGSQNWKIDRSTGPAITKVEMNYLLHPW